MEVRIGSRIIMKDEALVDERCRLKRGTIVAVHEDGPITTYLVEFDPPFKGHNGYLVDESGQGFELTPDNNGWWVGSDDFLVLEPEDEAAPTESFGEVRDPDGAPGR
jgi:hypothetical protein